MSNAMVLSVKHYDDHEDYGGGDSFVAGQNEQ